MQGSLRRALRCLQTSRLLRTGHALAWAQRIMAVSGFSFILIPIRLPWQINEKWFCESYLLPYTAEIRDIISELDQVDWLWHCDIEYRDRSFCARAEELACIAQESEFLE